VGMNQPKTWEAASTSRVPHDRTTNDDERPNDEEMKVEVKTD
jgi:hypothetical protein